MKQSDPAGVFIDASVWILSTKWKLWYIMQLKCLKMDLKYFVEFCGYIIPNVSDNVQTQRNPQVYTRLQVLFIWSPISATEIETSQKETQLNMNMNKTLPRLYLCLSHIRFFSTFPPQCWLFNAVLNRVSLVWAGPQLYLRKCLFAPSLITLLYSSLTKLACNCTHRGWGCPCDRSQVDLWHSPDHFHKSGWYSGMKVAPFF